MIYARVLLVLLIVLLALYYFTVIVKLTGLVEFKTKTKSISTNKLLIPFYLWTQFSNN